jgi:RND family efflux transporter MFP subunit
MSLIERTGKTKWLQIRIVLIGAGVILAGCGAGNERALQKAEVVQGLHLQKIQLHSVANELEAPGSVIAVSTAQLAARTMGTVLLVAVREGDIVKRGQVLAQLDERELSARRSAAQAASQGAAAGVVQATKAVAVAQAQTDVMQKTYDRYTYLKEQKSVSPQEFDEIAAKQQVAQAGLEQAKAGLRQAEAGASQADSEARAAQDVASYARVVAPFDGRVIRRSVEPGSLVSPGMPLFVVEDTSRYQLKRRYRPKRWQP